MKALVLKKAKVWQVKKYIKGRIAVRRVVDTLRVGEVVTGYINGENFVMQGGYTLAKWLKIYPVIETPPPTLPPERPRLWLVRHFVQIGDERRSRPGMQPLSPNHFVPFGERWQELSRNMNPKLSPQAWTQVYSGQRWIANRQGFGMDGDPRNNYVTGEIGRDWEDPKVEALTTTGSLLAGEPDGGLLHVVTLDWRNPPTLDYIMQRPWLWTYAVNVNASGKPQRFPQGEQADGSIVDIIHPLVCDPGRFDITLPLRLVQEWTRAEMPSPYVFY